MAQDVKDIFFDLCEFAEIHRIEYEETICVINSLGAQESGNQYPMSNATVEIMLPTEKAPTEKQAGELINIDGREFTVASWRENAGVTTIGLEGNFTN